MNLSTYHLMLYVPFALQALLMSFDEFYFHRGRGLPRWEILGHPLDSLTVFAAYLFLSLAAPTEQNIWIYVALSAFSCLFITKDEFVHTKLCDAKENWLHAMLFVVHPLTFLSAGLIWMQNLNPLFLKFQPYVVLAFLIYQVLFWQFFYSRPSGQSQLGGRIEKGQ